MRIRIAVASRAEVTFYDMQHIGDELQIAGQLTDPLAHMHDRDFKSDRPGRKSDRAPLTGGRRGSTAHHGIGAEQHPRKHEATIFAKRIATELEQARQADRFDRLIVMAEPSFLGVLRQALPTALDSTVVAEVPKDLSYRPVSAVLAHLPAAFRRDAR